MWFAHLVRESISIELPTAGNERASCLDRLAAQSPSKPRSGLATAIADTIEAPDAGHSIE